MRISVISKIKCSYCKLKLLYNSQIVLEIKLKDNTDRNRLYFYKLATSSVTELPVIVEYLCTYVFKSIYIRHFNILTQSNLDHSWTTTRSQSKPKVCLTASNNDKSLRKKGSHKESLKRAVIIINLLEEVIRKRGRRRAAQPHSNLNHHWTVVKSKLGQRRIRKQKTYHHTSEAGPIIR